MNSYGMLLRPNCSKGKLSLSCKAEPRRKQAGWHSMKGLAKRVQPQGGCFVGMRSLACLAAGWKVAEEGDECNLYRQDILPAAGLSPAKEIIVHCADPARPCTGLPEPLTRPGEHC